VFYTGREILRKKGVVSSNYYFSLENLVLCRIVKFKPSPQGNDIHGTILIFGEDEPLVMTRSHILGKAGYEVFTAQTFGNAMLMLMNHQIDLCVLCQTLTDEERRGILETARALRPEIKCVVLDFGEGENAMEGVDLIQGLVGPSTLLSTVGQLLTA
jgi:hypothetical protein